MSPADKLSDFNELVFERAGQIPNFWHALIFKAVATSVDIDALDGPVRLQCSHCERAGASEKSRTYWRGKYTELGHDEYVRRYCEQPTRNRARMIKNCIGCKVVAWGFDVSLVGLARSTLTGHVESTLDAGYIRPVTDEGRARKGERYRNPGEFQSRIYEVNPDFFDGLLVPAARTCSVCGCDISNRRADATTCGARCRQAARRKAAPAEAEQVATDVTLIRRGPAHGSAHGTVEVLGTSTSLGNRASSDLGSAEDRPGDEGSSSSAGRTTRRDLPGPSEAAKRRIREARAAARPELTDAGQEFVWQLNDCLAVGGFAGHDRWCPPADVVAAVNELAEVGDGDDFMLGLAEANNNFAGARSVARIITSKLRGEDTRTLARYITAGQAAYVAVAADRADEQAQAEEQADAKRIVKSAHERGLVEPIKGTNRFLIRNLDGSARCAVSVDSRDTMYADLRDWLVKLGLAPEESDLPADEDQQPDSKVA